MSFVIVIAIDFSKALNTVRHSSLLRKIAKLDIAEYVYNWILDFFAKSLTLHSL